MSQLRHGLPACLIAILAALSLWAIRGGDRIDQAISDALLTREGQTVSSKYVVVGITQEDLVRLDNVSRQHGALADILDQMRLGGADRILLDFGLSGNAAMDGDRELDRAIAMLGPKRVAIASMTQTDKINPSGLYAAGAVVEAALMPDKDGRFRWATPPSESRAANPALWLSTGRLVSGDTPLDLRLSPTSIKVLSLAQAQDPTARSQFKGKSIVISLSRSASRSRVAVPTYGPIDRGQFLAVAAQSIENGAVENRARAEELGIGLAAICLVIGLGLGFWATSARLVFLVAPPLACIVVAGMLKLVETYGQPIYPLWTLAIIALALVFAVAQRLRLPSLIRTFMAGDLSPEEAWAWRSQGAIDRPVVLLSAAGSIKRANPAAIRAFALSKAKRFWVGAEISQLCKGAFGQGPSHKVQLSSNPTTWRLEWLHDDIPLATFYDVTEQAVRMDELEQRLVTDPLTGIFNRVGFDRALDQVKLGQGERCGVFFLDLNGFKKINDTHGHAVGDELLKVVAKRFASVTRSQDVLARLGGDEFAILTRGDISTLNAVRTVDKLEGSLNGMVRLSGLAVQVGVAVGFALSTEEDASILEVVQRADQDMYERKRIQKMSNRGPLSGVDYLEYPATDLAKRA